MIPKIIHYCWFGGNEKPKNIQKYIAGWKEKLPEYQFMEWNESNFDIESSIPYVKEAYEARKFAFVSDYVRLHALCLYGGVYLDTDVELFKDISSFLDEAELLLGYETKYLLGTAFIAAVPQQSIINGFMNTYESRHFLCEDGTLDMTPINDCLSDYLAERGVVIEERMHEEFGNVKIYTSDYFSAQDVDRGHPYITENTYMIHRFDASWGNKLKGFAKVKSILKYKIIRPALHKVLGYEKTDKLFDKIKGRNE